MLEWGKILENRVFAQKYSLSHLYNHKYTIKLMIKHARLNLQEKKINCTKLEAKNLCVCVCVFFGFVIAKRN